MDPDDLLSEFLKESNGELRHALIAVFRDNGTPDERVEAVRTMIAEGLEVDSDETQGN